MSKTKVLMVTAAVMVALSGSIIAQQQAQVSLRSGERLVGSLMDYNGSDYTFRIDGRDRRISTNQIAIVELSGGRPLTGRQQADLAAGRPFVMLKSGEVVEGRLMQLGQSVGRRPRQVIIESSNGRRPYNLADVAGIYIAPSRVELADSRRDSQDRFGDRQGDRQGNRQGDRQNGGFNGRQDGGSNGAANGGRNGSTQPNDRNGAAASSTSGATIVIPGTQQWMATNLTVKTGETVRFQASGQVQYSPDAEDRAAPQGSPKRHTVAGAPMPAMPGGALIGRIDNGQPFWIGDQSTISMPAGGALFIGLNDDRVGDNSGQFSVVMSR